MPKYFNDQAVILRSDHYHEVFERKGVKFLKILRTKTFESVQGLELEIQTEHIWSKGDTLYRLSQKYYGTQNLWTAIALINTKPTDAHYSIGDIVYIVKDPNFVLRGL